MNAKRNALGRGLGALLEANDTATDSINESKPLALFIPLEKIEVNPYQPRTNFDAKALADLAASIKQLGIIQPLTVRSVGEQYQLIAGERRLRAAQLIGLEKVPAYLVETNNQGMLEMALVENIQRDDLNPLEIALSYKRLIDECNLKQEELGERVGKDRSTVTNFLRLLRLPPEIQASLRDKSLTMGHAKALLSLEHIDHQLSIFADLMREGWSVRKTESMVKAIQKPKETDRVIPKNSIKNNQYLDPNLRHLQDQLERRFDAKVTIKPIEGDKGEIVIPYLSNDDLNRILELIDL